MDAPTIPQNQQNVGEDYKQDITNLQTQVADLTTIINDLTDNVGSPTALQYPIDPISYNSIANAFPGIGGGLPSNPSQGDIVYYNGTAWVLLTPGSFGQVLETQGASANPVWATQLPSASQGDILYYNGSTWTNLGPGTSGEALITGGISANPSWEFVVYTGTITLFATSSAPSGWLLCNGQGVSTSTYAALFTLIGYTYGGSGTTFNVPVVRSPNVIVQSGATAQFLHGTNYVDVYTTPGIYNWQCPIGITSIQVECYGGGASGYNSGSVGGVPGGGGGGYGIKTITVVPGTIYSLTVAAGGGAATGGYNPGADSWFISDVTVAGKGGGTGGNSYTAGGYAGDSGYNGGAGGVASGLGGATGSGYGGVGGTSSGLAGGGGGGAGGNGTNGNSGAGGGGTGNAGTPGAGGGNYLQFGGESAVGLNGGTFGGGGAGFYGTGFSGAGASGAVFVTYGTPPLQYIIKT